MHDTSLYMREGKRNATFKNDYKRQLDKSDFIKSAGGSSKVCSIKYGVTGAAELLENFHAKGIYYGEEMVGFTLYGLDEEDHEHWIYRMMIDQKHQGKGYGKEAVQLVIEDIQKMKEPHHQTISLSYEPDNEHAKRIYKKWASRK